MSNNPHMQNPYVSEVPKAWTEAAVVAKRLGVPLLEVRPAAGRAELKARGVIA